MFSKQAKMGLIDLKVKSFITILEERPQTRLRGREGADQTYAKEVCPTTNYSS